MQIFFYQTKTPPSDLGSLAPHKTPSSDLQMIWPLPKEYLSGITDISKIRSYHMKVEIDSQTFEDDYIWGAVCNSTSIAGIIKLDDKIVDYNDGLFEVLLIKSPKTLIDMTKIIVSLNTQDYRSDMITFFQGKEARITSDQPIAWSLDGEYNPGGRNVSISNIPGAIRIKC